MDKLEEQLSRLSRWCYILNQIDNLQCIYEQDKSRIHLLLYENDNIELESVIDKIKDKSEEFVYKEINILCYKLKVYRDNYNN